MQNLDRWIAAYEAMDARRRRLNLIGMEGQARRFPAKKRPKLSVVAGGAGLGGVRDVLDVGHDGRPKLGIASIVKIK